MNVKKVVIASILVPQSNGLWDPGSLDKLLAHVLEKNPTIDSNRIYCNGYSMGGKGTWEWAMASLERFAAIISKGFIPDLLIGILIHYGLIFWPYFERLSNIWLQSSPPDLSRDNRAVQVW
jgi:hypothetical protein